MWVPAAAARVGRREGTIIKRELKKAADKAADKAAGKTVEVMNSKPLGILARCGFAVSGALHLLIGLIAFGVAAGGSGHADVTGAVAALANQPAGPLLLWVSFAACVSLALWQAGDAIFDFERLPTKHKTGKRLKADAQAAVYTAMAFTLAAFARGTDQDDGESTSDLTVNLMNAPGGVLLLVLIGAGVAILGIIYAIRGVRKSFQKHINLPPSPAGHKAITALGITGYVSKGVALFATGLSALIATVTVHPEQAGLDAALHALRDQPYGTYVVAVVGAGLACYGLFTIVRAHLAKM